MKTKIILKLKKELLLVELPEDTQFDVLVNNPLWKDGIKFLKGTDDKFHFIKGSYTVLGSPDEIKEDVAKELVKQIGEGQKINMFGWKNYKNEYLWCKTALESFFSALESEIYWNVNPFKKPNGEDYYYEERHCFDGVETLWDGGSYHEDLGQFNEAQEKTFDKKRTLIFVKN